MAKIAVYLADFNPIHVGHLEFALKARDKYFLDKVYFLPERNLQDGEYYVHLGHRVSMLKQALKPYPKFNILESDYRVFDLNKTLPKIRQKFSSGQLFLLMDLKTYSRFKLIKNKAFMLGFFHIVIGLTSRLELQQLKDNSDKQLDIIFNKNLAINNQVQSALFKNKFTEAGLLKSVIKYSLINWLYVSLDN